MGPAYGLDVCGFMWYHPGIEEQKPHKSKGGWEDEE